MEINEVFGNGFGSKVALYLPGTRNLDQALTAEETERLLGRAHDFLAKTFGGATSYRALGSWVSESGTLVIENVTIVYAYAPELTREKLLAVKQFALDVKTELGQETVAVEINDNLFFV